MMTITNTRPVITKVMPKKQVQFSGGLNQFVRTPQAGTFLKLFDYERLPHSAVNQIKLIYGLVIISRIRAALSRGSWNEAREHATRDIMGWTFWFYAMPAVQRMFVKALVGMPKEYREALLHHPDGVKPTTGALKKLGWHLKSLFNSEMPSAIQIEARCEQALNLIDTQAKTGRWKQTAVDGAKKQVNDYFHKLKNYRNFASFTGLVGAIALLGFGVVLFNIYMTRKNLSASQKH